MPGQLLSLLPLAAVAAVAAMCGAWDVSGDGDGGPQVRRSTASEWGRGAHWCWWSAEWGRGWSRQNRASLQHPAFLVGLACYGENCSAQRLHLCVYRSGGPGDPRDFKRLSLFSLEECSLTAWFGRGEGAECGVNEAALNVECRAGAEGAECGERRLRCCQLLGSRWTLSQPRRDRPFASAARRRIGHCAKDEVVTGLHMAGGEGKEASLQLSCMPLAGASRRMSANWAKVCSASQGSSCTMDLTRGVRRSNAQSWTRKESLEILRSMSQDLSQSESGDSRTGRTNSSTRQTQHGLTDEQRSELTKSNETHRENTSGQESRKESNDGTETRIDETTDEETSEDETLGTEKRHETGTQSEEGTDDTEGTNIEHREETQEGVETSHQEGRTSERQKSVQDGTEETESSSKTKTKESSTAVGAEVGASFMGIGASGSVTKTNTKGQSETNTKSNTKTHLETNTDTEGTTSTDTKAKSRLNIKGRNKGLSTSKTIRKSKANHKTDIHAVNTSKSKGRRNSHSKTTSKGATNSVSEGSTESSSESVSAGFSASAAESRTLTRMLERTLGTESGLSLESSRGWASEDRRSYSISPTHSLSREASATLEEEHNYQRHCSVEIAARDHCDNPVMWQWELVYNEFRIRPLACHFFTTCSADLPPRCLPGCCADQDCQSCREGSRECPSPTRFAPPLDPTSPTDYRTQIADLKSRNQCGQPLPDVDLSGGHLLASETAETQSSCCKLCLERSGCLAWVWLSVTAQCKLMASLEYVFEEPAKDVVSGVLAEFDSREESWIPRSEGKGPLRTGPSLGFRKPVNDMYQCASICRATRHCGVALWDSLATRRRGAQGQVQQLYGGGTCWLYQTDCGQRSEQEYPVGAIPIVLTRARDGDSLCDERLRLGHSEEESSCGSPLQHSQRWVEIAGEDLKVVTTYRGCCSECLDTDGCVGWTQASAPGRSPRHGDMVRCHLKATFALDKVPREQSPTTETRASVFLPRFSGRAGCSEPLAGQAFEGQELAVRPDNPDPHFCCGLCKATRGCRAYVWEGAGGEAAGHCRLMAAYDPRLLRSHPTAISGFLFR